MQKRWRIKIEKQTLVDLQEQGKSQQEMAELLGVSIWTVERRIKTFNLQNYSSVHYEKMHVNDPIFCYLLGWFCTDGYLSSGNHLRLRIYDKEVIEILQQYFNCSMFTIPSKKKTQICYELYFNKAPDIFRKCYTSSKTFDVEVPSIPIKNIDMFVRGVIEGDGCIRIPGTSKSTLVRLFTNSKLFAEQLQTLVPIDNFSFRIRRDRMGWELSTGNIELLKYVYRRHLQFVCKRKYDRFQQWLSI